MYEKGLSELPKEKLIELCNELLSEMYYRGDLSNNYIINLIREHKEEEK